MVCSHTAKWPSFVRRYPKMVSYGVENTPPKTRASPVNARLQMVSSLCNGALKSFFLHSQVLFRSKFSVTAIRDPFGWSSKKAIGSWPNWLHLFWRSDRKGFQQANRLFNPGDVGNRWTANWSKCYPLTHPDPNDFAFEAKTSWLKSMTRWQPAFCFKAALWQLRTLKKHVTT